MDFLTTPDQKLKAYLWAVTDFVLAHRSDKVACRHMDRNQLFKWIAFCHLTGRLWTRVENGQVVAIVIAQSDWVEHVEAKAEYARAQFEWTKQTPGDCLSVGDVIGNARAIKQIWDEACAHYPALLVCPIYTFRKEKLVKLSVGKIERMFRRERV